MKKTITFLVLLILLSLGFSSNNYAQLSGTYSIPGSYPTGFATIKMAVDTLNAKGVNGAVIFNVAAGHTETNANITLTNTTPTATWTVTFQKWGGGLNPRITAGTGTSTTVDGIIKFGGTDYVTFDAIDLIENTSNVTPTTRMEWGYAICKGSATNGSQYITIKNCRIGLKDTLTTEAIHSGNHLTTSTSALTVSAFSGTNSYNKIYGVTVDSAYYGIWMGGYNASSPYNLFDHFNEVGVEGANYLYRKNTFSGTGTSYGIYTIYQDSIKIANNTVNWTGSGTTYCIMSSTAVNSSVDIYGNTCTAKGTGTSSNVSAIYNTAGGTAASNSIRIFNNVIENCSYPSATSGTFYYIYCSSSADTVKIYGNIIRNDSTPSTGTLYGIYGGSPNNLYIYNNQIYNIKRYGSGAGTSYIMYPVTSKVYVYGNTIRGFRHGNGKTGTIYGLYDASSPTVFECYNNTYDSIQSEGTGTVYGIYNSFDISTTSPNYRNNTFSTISSDSGAVYGIYHNAAATASIYSNRLYNLSVNSDPVDICYGIYLSSATTYNIYNNFISDIRTPVSTNNIGYAGINASGGSSINLYYNTIYLNGSSSGTTFGSAAIYASVTPNLDMRNNIIVNVSTPGNGSYGAKTVVYRRSGSSLTTYLNTSNNNCFYAGSSTTDTSRVLFYDGTVSGGYDMTMPAYKSRVSPRDAQSFRELPPFRDITAAPRATPYDLRIDTTIKTSCESGAQTISTPNITTDYFGIPRYPNPGYPNNDSAQYAATAPDVGASEFGGKPQDISGPVIVYTPVTATIQTEYKDITNISISDASGVDFNTGTAPRIYYKKSTNSNSIDIDDTTNVTDGWKYSETEDVSSPCTLTMYFSRLYGGAPSTGDTIQYFVVAQDLMATPNVSINAGTFASQPSSVALTSSAFPVTGAINRMLISNAYTGTINVGAGYTYRNLTSNDSGLFKAINSGVVTGNITALITSDITEPGTVALNQTSEELNYTITIKPDTATLRTLSGSYAGGLIRLNGADRVTIDGRYGGSGNYLTIQNTSTSANTAAIQVISLGAGQGATNDTIRNCNILTGTNTAVTYGMYSGSATIGTAGADNEKLCILYNNISKCYYGIGIYGILGGEHDSVQIKGNSIGSNNSSDYILYYGIYTAYMRNSMVSNNEIFNMKSNNAKYGIYAATGSSYNRYSKNKIHDMNDLTGNTTINACLGMAFETGLTDNIIDNNVLYNIFFEYGTTNYYYSAAIRIIGGTNYKIYYNSISMTGTMTRATSNCYAICLETYTTAPTNLDVRNNVFYNAVTNPGYAVYTLALYTIAGTTFSSLNYNDYYTTGTNIGYYNGAFYADFPAWKAATGKDTNSFSANPIFNNSVNDLRPDLSSPLLSAGVPLSGFDTDFLDSARNVTYPTVGAYEKGIDVTPPNISYTPLGNGSSLTTRPFENVSITDGSGVDTASGTRPRVYYKKISNANTYAGNTNTDDGWKWKEADTNASPFKFTIDYSKILGGTVSQGDTIQYFVVAQDMAGPYVGINSGTFNSQPASVNLTAGAFPLTGTINNYRLLQGFSGTIPVGAGQTYTTLTGTGGLFEAINAGTVTGNINATIKSDIEEPGTVALNQTSEEINYNIRIIPDTAVLRTLYGTYAGGLIRLNGADRVTIDGSYNGSGMYLKFRNRYNSTSAYTINLLSDASYDTVKNCYLHGFGYVVYFGAATTTGNNYNVFDNVDITDADSIGLRPSYGIYRYSKTLGFKLMNSRIHNVSSYGIYNYNSSYTDSNVVYQNNDIYRFGSYGIYMYYWSGNALIEGNRIYQDTANYSGSSNYGIYIYYSNAGATLTIRKNKIYNLAGTSSATLKGIYDGSNTVASNVYIYNNVISIGSSTATTGQVDGIDYYGSTQNNRYIYYNSIYIGGSDVASGNSYGIEKRDLVNIYYFKNNSVQNARSNGAGTGKHYAYSYSELSAADWQQNYNDFYVSGTGGVLTLYDVTDYNSLAGWKGISGKDTNSINADPLYSNPVVNDLQPVAGSSLKNAGNPVSGIATDILDTLRSVTTPTIGAYEKLTPDVTGPVIAYTPLSNSSLTTNRILTGFATITDVGSGVDTASGTRPRIYYKKSTDANTFAGNTNTDDGWKWKEADTNASPFSFTIDYSIIYGGSVILGDTVQYFIVAQDIAVTPNVSINSGTFNNPPSSVNLTSAQFPLTGTIRQYLILSAYTGTINVGTGQTYTSLTGTNGLFAAINNGVVTGNMTVQITSDLTETGAIPLNETTEELNYTINIVPDAAVNRTISGNYAGGLIRLNGADRITIDGRYGGSGNYLTIQNTSTASYTAAIQLISLGIGTGATNNTIRNCNIKGGSNTVTSAFGIYAGAATISTSGTGADFDYLTIKENNISKCFFGIYLRGVATTGEADSLKIQGNSIGSNASADYVTGYGMSTGYINSAEISNNEIYNMIYDGSKYGIYFYYDVKNSIVSKNKIHTFSQSNTTTSYYAIGIYFISGTNNINNRIDNNAIYDLWTYGNTTVYYNVGIRIAGGDGYKIYFNSISLTGAFGNTAANMASACVDVSSAATNIDLRNNSFYNSRSGTTPKSFTVYTVASTTFTYIDRNDYYSTSSVLGYYNGTEIADFNAWKAATTADTNSINQNPKNTSATNLIPAIGSPLIGVGIPISGTGLDKDMLDTLRSVTAPSMGAYEQARDLAGPEITYTVLGNTTSTSSRVLTQFATITDAASGVDTALGTRPRIYYRKSTDSNTFTGNTSAFSCWKWAEADTNASPFTFTIDYSKLYPSGSVSLGDIIQYFVVAQDLAPPPDVVHTSSNPSDGFSGTTVGNITSAPLSPNAYGIVGSSPLSGTYTVGLSSFNKISGKNLVPEKRTRQVTIETEEEVVKGYKMVNSESVNTDNKSRENPNGKTNVLTANQPEDAPFYEPVTEKIKFKKTVEETYYVLTENGQDYTGSLYYDINANKQKQIEKTLTDKIKGNEGNKETGETDDVRGVYATLSGAIMDLNSNGLSGAVIFQLIDNIYDYETYPITINEINGVSPTNTVTIKPGASRTPVMTGNAPVSMFILDGSDYIIFDGSNSAYGTSKDLTFRNTNTTGAVVILRNGAQYDTLKNCKLEGSSTSAANGVIYIATADSSANKFDVIINNNISSRTDAASEPASLIYSNGTAVDSLRNFDISILNNNFFNFPSNGIYVTATGNGNNWIISGNHFYQENTYSTSQYAVRFIPGTSGNNNLISGNYIGGQSPNCGGGYWTVDAKVVTYGIYLTVGTATATSVQGNTIQNIQNTVSDTTGLSGGTIYCMYFTGGFINTGTVTANTMGSPTVTYSIKNASTGAAWGLYYTAVTGIIANNVIGNIVNVNPSSDSISNYYGIRVAGDYNVEIRNNYIVNVGHQNPSAMTNYVPAGIMDYGTSSAMVNAYYIYNNVISMANYHNNDIGHYGIWDYSAGTKSYIWYNSIYIGGTHPYPSLIGTPACYYKQNTSTTYFANNACFNNRANSYAFTLEIGSITNFSANYNTYYSSTDTTAFYWSVAMHNFASYKSTSGMDTTSYYGNPAFTSATDLRPDTTNVNCWNLNGKGLAITLINIDFRYLPRFTSVTSGPTDIGAYEFTTALNPPASTPSGPPAPSTTTNYTNAGRPMVDITWGSSDNIIKNNSVGTDKINSNSGKNPVFGPDALPSTVNVYYFSGVTPPDTADIPVALTGKGYWMITTGAGEDDPSQPVNYKFYWGDQEIGNTGTTENLTIAMYDMKNRIWLPFDTASSGTGYAIKNNTAKTITVNGIPRVDSVCFALTAVSQPLKRLKLDVTAIIAGFWWDRGSGYNTMKPDTIAAIIRTANPWTVIDTIWMFLDSMGYGYGFTSLANVENGYYIEINHRNSLSTWSSDSTTGFSRVLGTKAFDFTSVQTQAYGSNMIQVGTKWCIINGDINRDDWIDGSDYLDIFNNYDTGGEFLTPDTNGDDWIDGSDYLIIFNNYDVGATNPITGKLMRPVRKIIRTEIMNRIMQQMQNVKK